MSSKTSINKQVRASAPVQDAPPPSYQASTSQPISHPDATHTIPSHRPQPFLHPSPSGNIVIYNYEGWTPPANDGVARARARRRFFVALAWGFFIWIVLGAILGGGAADMSAGSRHRGSRHDGRIHTWFASQSNEIPDTAMEEVSLLKSI